MRPGHLRPKGPSAAACKSEQPIPGVVIQVRVEDVRVLIVATHGVEQLRIEIGMASSGGLKRVRTPDALAPDALQAVLGIVVQVQVEDAQVLIVATHGVEQPALG